MQEGISIVICCYNSAARLPETLRHLANQQVNLAIPVEVLVVNNASIDNTAEVALTTWTSLQSGIPFAVIDEQRPGKKYALETGFQLANYSYVLICDDDNWLSNTYVQTAYQIMHEDETIAALGGTGEAVCEIAPPEWFEKAKDHYAVGPQSSRSGDITQMEGRLYGAGMVVNKLAWLAVLESGYEYFLTCRKGDSLSSGGDLEMCYVFRMLGYKIYYDDRLVFKHYIPKERLSWSYLVKLFPKFAEAEVFLEVFKFLKNKAYRKPSDFTKAYIKSLLKVGKCLWRSKSYTLQVLSSKINEGDKEALYALFYYSKLKVLLTQKQQFLWYLSYVNNFKLRTGTAIRSQKHEKVS